MTVRPILFSGPMVRALNAVSFEVIRDNVDAVLEREAA